MRSTIPAVLVLLLVPGCVLPVDDEASRVFRVPDFVIPERIVYESSPGHEVQVTFLERSDVPGTFGPIAHALVVQVLHPEADWNNDLQKQETYDLENNHLESLYLRTGVVWESSNDMGRWFVGRCDDDAFRPKMGDVQGSHSFYAADMYVALAVAGKTLTDGETFRYQHGTVKINTRAIPEGQLVVVRYAAEEDRGNGPYYMMRLVYNGSLPYPTELGRFTYRSSTPADGVPKTFSTSFDRCGDYDPTDSSLGVARDEFFEAARPLGPLGEALAEGVAAIETSPQFTQWAFERQSVTWTSFRASRVDTTMTGVPNWVVDLQYTDVGGARLDTHVELVRTPAGWSPSNLQAMPANVVAPPALHEMLVRPNELRDVEWDGPGLLMGSSEQYANYPPGTLISRNGHEPVVAVSFVDGGRYWLRGMESYDPPH